MGNSRPSDEAWRTHGWFQTPLEHTLSKPVKAEYQVTETGAESRGGMDPVVIGHGHDMEMLPLLLVSKRIYEHEQTNDHAEFHC